MIYTEEVQKELNNILKAFEKYIDSQSYFDILYSKKVGYLWIVVDPPGGAGAQQLDTPEDMLDDVKSFVSNYNSTVNASKNLNSYSILQTTVWMTGAVKTSSGILDKMGISINEDNTLSLDEAKFKKAQLSTVKSAFSSGSIASRISAKASSLSNQSANQIAENTGKKTYTSSGTIKY